MPFKHRHTRTFSSPTAASIQNTIEVENAAEIAIDETVPDGTTDLNVPCAFDSDRIKAFYCLSTKDLTIETVGGSPSANIAVEANRGFSWIDGDPGDPPFPSDVTALLISTPSGGDDAVVKIRILHDPTA